MFRIWLRPAAAMQANRWWPALYRSLCVPLCLIFVLFAGGSARGEETFLEPGQAFQFSARMQDPGTVVVTYEIAEGYYMYRERFAFDAADAKLGVAEFPPGKVKFDDTFQKNVETYRHAVSVTIPVQSTGLFTLKVTSQGCSDKGLCYAPQEATARLFGNSAAAPLRKRAAVGANASLGAAPLSSPAGAATAHAGAVAPVAAAPAKLGQVESIIKSGRLLLIIPGFFLFGLIMSGTACLLPMVPILSAIIVGEGQQVTRARGLLLSATYVLGMAMVYTGLGMAAGLIGEGLAAAMQKPWVLGLFALMMTALAMSMFGLYELQVPAALQSRLVAASNRQQGGRLAGVFVMGVISAVIVGPCVGPPLAGVLLYIGQTHDVVIGGVALFSTAIGMGGPLLLVGISAGTLLPRAGAWMIELNRFFGVLLLATAWWLLSPVLPAVLPMLGWSLLGVGYGMYLMTKVKGWLGKAGGVLFLAFGLMQLVGVASGGRDALAPLAHLGGAAVKPVHFVRIKTVAQLDAALAQTGGKPALLDFYADWCVACKEMEKLTFVDAAVRARMEQAVLLQVDVTANDADDKAMLKRFNLFGPPGIILFDKQGKEIPDARVIGYQNSKEFLTSLSKLP